MLSDAIKVADNAATSFVFSAPMDGLFNESGRRNGSKCCYSPGPTRVDEWREAEGSDKTLRVGTPGDGETDRCGAIDRNAKSEATERGDVFRVTVLDFKFHAEFVPNSPVQVRNFAVGNADGFESHLHGQSRCRLYSALDVQIHR